MVVAAEHLGLEIVAYAVDKLDFEERLSADEVPYHRLFGEVVLMVENIVDCRLGHVPRHALLLVLAHKIAIPACKLAILRDDEGDSLSSPNLPSVLGLK